MVLCVFGNSKGIDCTDLFDSTKLTHLVLSSEYPSKRFVKGSDDLFEGVAGNLQLVEETGVAPQPVTAFRWSADHLGLAACTSFDQTLRVLAVTGLNCI